MLLPALLLSFVACSKTDNSTDSASGENTSRVFLPEDLLSASEATELSGFQVSIDSGSLVKDSQLGTISERYRYDINDMNTAHALVQIEEDGFKPADEINNGNTARHSFETEMSFSKNEITAVSDLGDEAFTFNNNGQLHMLYGGYYVVVAFDADAYTNDKNAQLNITIGHRILANLKEKL